MSTPTLRTFLRLAHRHYEVLKALFGVRTGMQEAAFRARLAESVQSARPGYVFRQLQTHRLVTTRRGETASVVLTPFLRQLFGTFRREQVLSTPTPLRAYLDRLEELVDRLEQAGAQAGEARQQRVLTAIDAEIDQIQMLSRSHRDAVLNRVMQLRADPDAHSVRERFEIINELIGDYVKPLREIVQSEGAFETRFERLGEVLGAVQEDAPAASERRRYITALRHRLRSVRAQVLTNFEAAHRETMRLCETQQRNSALLEGAATLLKRVHHDGPEALEALDPAAPVSFAFRTAFWDEGLRAFLEEMAGYTPPDPDPLPVSTPAPPPSLQPRDALIEAACAADPIPDALAWVLERLDVSTPRRVLRAYRLLLQSPKLRATFGTERRHYDLAPEPVQIHAVPVRLTVADEAAPPVSA